jgi:hypothetical protein
MIMHGTFGFWKVHPAANELPEFTLVVQVQRKNLG